MRSWLLLLAAFVLVAVAGGLAWWRVNFSPAVTVDSYEACAAAGYPILETYPAQCRAPDGRTFVQPTTTGVPVSELRVSSPRPHETVGSSFTVRGTAPGSWYFEGSFPIRVDDATGNLLVQTVAHAQGEWMTAELVPFQVQLTLPVATRGPIRVILARDNPSGLPEHAAQVTLPLIVGE